ncbi:MAG: PPC domain-containing DNA-binding protein [Candidatus Paceibacterota bacterium]
MSYQHTTFGYIIRIPQGDGIKQTLEEFCADQKINGGSFFGIGAVRSATIGMYHINNFEYTYSDITKPHEITNLTGNVALYDETLLIHAHITLAGADHQACGGHLKEAIAEPTCEITLFTHDPLQRTYDERSCLPLLDLPNN